MHNQAEEAARLRELLPAGSRIFVVNRFTSRDGSYRTVDVYRARISQAPPRMDGANFIVPHYSSVELERITGAVCRVTGYRYDSKRESLGLGGSGFNAAESVRDKLAAVLHGNENSLEFQEI